MASSEEGYELISMAEYARRTEKTRSLIYYYVDRGYLETEKIGKVRYIKIPKEGELPKPKNPRTY
jgi:hypothetical protein